VEKGWISLSRKIQDSFVWKDKPFSKGQAWIDLLLSVNHEDNKFLLGNELIMCERGSMVTSVRKLTERWGWSNTKTVNFLNLLESDEMIVQKKDTKKTVISIVKYDDYQNSENTKKTVKRHESDTRATRERTNNNDNNDNNVNNNISSRFTPPTLEEVRAYCLERGNKVDCEKWFDFYESKGWYVGKNKMKNWKAAVRTWEKEDKDKPVKEAKSTNKFNQFPQREYSQTDYSSLEQALLNKGK
jgi:hypothetical protein